MRSLSGPYALLAPYIGARPAGRKGAQWWTAARRDFPRLASARPRPDVACKKEWAEMATCWSGA